MISRYEIQVEAEYNKARLEDLLLAKFAELSKMYLRELVKNLECEVNGRYENVGYRLRTNDLIEITIDTDRGTAMRPENIELDIVYEDRELIVVNKPFGMLVHPSHKEKTGTLLNALVYRLKQSDSRSVRPGLPHRLDKETSGLLVAAKTGRAQRILSGHFMSKRVVKSYVAMVEGVVKAETGNIEAPIGRFDELKHWSVKADGKPSATTFRVRERFGDTTLLDLEPITGRTNQLRIHCESIGHPIVGDVRRGGRLFGRLCLHAHKLAFPHPGSNEIMEFESPFDFSPKGN